MLSVSCGGLRATNLSVSSLPIISGTREQGQPETLFHFLYRDVCKTRPFATNGKRGIYCMGTSCGHTSSTWMHAGFSTSRKIPQVLRATILLGSQYLVFYLQRAAFSRITFVKPMLAISSVVMQDWTANSQVCKQTHVTIRRNVSCLVGMNLGWEKGGNDFDG